MPAWDQYGDIVLVALLAGVPVGAIVTLALGQGRIDRGWERRWAWRASVAEVAIVVGTLPGLWMLLAPRHGGSRVDLVPFHDLVDLMSDSDAAAQIVGNLLAFAAVGFFLPIRLRLARPALVPLAIALIVAALSLTIEVLQFVLDIGRVASFDDIMLNIAGAVVACVASIRWWRSRRGPA
ncbi:VanZ family protein [Microbacterium sp. E-13]|uniref:VanZ family protein n=1 Tax=Microbacterium sp. E-13 TaxID=3404048 RepID=UPI003CF725D3